MFDAVAKYSEAINGPFDMGDLNLRMGIIDYKVCHRCILTVERPRGTDHSCVSRSRTVAAPVANMHDGSLIPVSDKSNKRRGIVSRLKPGLGCGKANFITNCVNPFCHAVLIDAR